jgi:hypothetical protein
MKGGMKTLKISGMIAMGFILVWAFVLATMYLWNWLIPALFAGPVISFWQAAGILALSKILFGGLGKGGGHRGHWKSRWDSRWQEKWNSMTPEDQERFKQKMMRLKYKMEDKWCSPQAKQKEETRKENSGVDSGNSIV